MDGQWNDDQDGNESPNTDDSCHEYTVTQFPAHGHEKEGVDSDGKHEKTTSRVANLQPETLQETRCCVCRDLVLCDPFYTNQEGQGLLKISQDEVVNKNDILIITDVSSVIGAPKQHSIGNEPKEDESRYEGENSHHRNGDKSLMVFVRKRIDVHDGLPFLGERPAS